MASNDNDFVMDSGDDDFVMDTSSDDDFGMYSNGKDYICDDEQFGKRKSRKKSKKQKMKKALDKYSCQDCSKKFKCKPDLTKHIKSEKA